MLATSKTCRKNVDNYSSKMDKKHHSICFMLIETFKSLNENATSK
jgi:hypothetical protein